MDGKWKCINLQQTDILTCPYEEIKYLGGNFLGILNCGKWGAYTEDGEEVISSSYDDIKFIELNCFAVKSEGLWGLVSTNEVGITEIKYDRIENIYEGKYIEAYIGSKKIYLDSLGKEYDEWYPDAMKYGFYLPKDKTYLIDKEGHFVSFDRLGHVWSVSICKDNSWGSIFRKEYDYVNDEMIRRYVNPWKKYSYVCVSYDPPLRDYEQKAYFWIYNPQDEKQKAILFESLYACLQYSAEEVFKSKITIPFTYKACLLITNGICDYLIVQKSDFSNNWGLISSDREIYPCEFLSDFIFISIDRLQIHEGDHYFIGNLNGERISENYISIEKKEDYLYCKLESEHYHILDFNGNFQGEYIKGEFFNDKVEPTPYNVVLRKIIDAFWLIKNKGKYGIIDQDGKVLIDCLYDVPLEYMEGIYFKTQKNKLYGIVNFRNEVILPFNYKNIENFRGNISAIQSVEGKWGFINKLGQITIPCQYTYCDFQDNVVKVRKYPNKNCNCYNQLKDNSDGGIDVLNIEGVSILKNSYVYIKEFCYGVAAVKGANGKWGYIDTEGNEIIPLIYDKVGSSPHRFEKPYMKPLPQLLFSVESDNQSIYIDKEQIEYKGEYLNEESLHTFDQDQLFYSKIKFIKRKYDKIVNERDWCEFRDQLNGMSEYFKPFETITIVCKYSAPNSYDKKPLFGLLNDIGDEIQPCHYSCMKKRGKYIYVQKDALWGILDEYGREIIKCKYDSIEEFENNSARIKKNDLVGLLNTWGQELVSCKYNAISNLIEGKYRIVCLNEKYNLLDEYGNELFEWKYDYIYSLIDGKAMVELRKYFNPKHPYLHLEDWSLFNEWRRNTWKIEQYGKNELACKCLYGVINVKGEEELACIYDNGDDEACHKIKNHSWGEGFVMIGSVDIDISHSDVFSGTENGCIFRIDGKYGFKKMKRIVGYNRGRWTFKYNAKE